MQLLTLTSQPASLLPTSVHPSIYLPIQLYAIPEPKRTYTIVTVHPTCPAMSLLGQVI